MSKRNKRKNKKKKGWGISGQQKSIGSINISRQNKKKVLRAVESKPVITKLNKQDKENLRTTRFSEYQTKAESMLKNVIGDEINIIDREVVEFSTHMLEKDTEKNARDGCMKLFNSFGINSESIEVYFNELEENKLFGKNDLIVDGEDSIQLKNTISFGRTLEEEKLAENRQTELEMKYNDEIDWDEEKLKELEEKRFLKKQKEEMKKKREYEKYLKESGISKAKGMIKMHRDEERGSTEINITLKGLSIGSKELLEETPLILKNHAKYGLVGANGIGKTTLLRAIFEREFENIPTYLQILHVEQEVEITDVSPLECLLKTDAERTNLLEEEEKILNGTQKDDGRLMEIYERMNEIDAHSAEARASEILNGLSFTPEMQKASIKKLSGGWRKRVSIARALFLEPDILLLDEPTNHLDLSAVIWLESFIAKMKNTCVIVSHQKDFLNNTCDNIIHFHNKKLNYYKGDYFTFEETRRRNIMQQQKTVEAQEKQRKHIQSFIDKFRFKTKTAGLVQSRIKALKKMSFIPSVVLDKEFKFSFPQPSSVFDGAYFQLINVGFGYTQKKEDVLFKKVNFSITKNSRIALVGENGIGKSTLFKIISRQLTPIVGVCQHNPMLKLAVFSQHHSDALNLALTPIEYIRKKYKKLNDEQARSALGRLGIKPNTQEQSIYQMSGGEKSRLVFCDITMQGANCLLLDEPSNHLDTDTIDALCNAINEFNGPVIMVSHDSYLIRHTCDDIYVLENQSVHKFKGDFDSYKKKVMTK